MSDNAILYELTTSLKRHIYDHWHAAIYDRDGNEQTAGYIVPELEAALSYTDRNGVGRIFGPAVVQVGPHKDSPLSLAGLSAVPSSFLEIHAGSPGDGEWVHELATGGNEDNAGVRPLWAHEIGGGQMFWRRLGVSFSIYMIDSDQVQEEAYRLGTAALSFVESLCQSYAPHRPSWSWPLQDASGQTIKDPFGEKAIQSLVVKSESRQRGGPESATAGDWIWDGSVWLQVLTRKGR